ncbi:MAG: hypothetical protein KDA71_21100 [Planctomycetales bacterium]|nr:hypothetical protein [Planctomycetales bacterium]
MAQFTRSDLNDLLTADDGPRVSIYLPTEITGRETRQNAIRFKNAMKEAAAKIDGHADAGQLKTQLRNAERLIDDAHFWLNQSDGLAMFIDAEGIRAFRLPHRFEQRVVVGERYFITPLLPVLHGDATFYIVAVSENHARLLLASRDSVAEVPDAELPESLQAVAEKIDTKSFFLHSFNVRMRNQNSAVPHGHESADKLPDLRRYLIDINEAVADAIADPGTPLVFAGVERLFALYRDVNTHDGLQAECVAGNADDSNADQLRAAAWKIVEPLLQSRRQEAVDRYGAVRNTDRSGEGLEAIRTAIRDGRVELLLLANDFANDAAATSPDELENLAMEAMGQGGEVYLVPADQLPASGVAAVYRYAVADELANQSTARS